MLKEELENDILLWLEKTEWRFCFENDFLGLYLDDTFAGVLLPAAECFMWSTNSPLNDKKYGYLYTKVKLQAIASVFRKKMGIELKESFL